MTLFRSFIFTKHNDFPIECKDNFWGIKPKIEGNYSENNDSEIDGSALLEEKFMRS